MISCIYIFVRNISQLGILAKLLTVLFPTDINWQLFLVDSLWLFDFAHVAYVKFIYKAHVLNNGNSKWFS